MDTNEILKIQNSDIEYSSIDSCKQALSKILDFAGVKEEEPSDYVYIIRFKRDIIYKVGYSAYAVYITNHYNDHNKKVFKIRIQTEYVYSFTIKPFIVNAINECRAILTNDMNKLINV